MRLFITLLMVLLYVACWAGEDTTKPEVELPYKARTAVTTFDRKVEDLNKKFLKEYDKLLHAAVKDLETAKKDEMKRGKLDEAVAIQAKIDDMTAKVQRDILGHAIVPKEPKEKPPTFPPGRYLMTSVTSGHISLWTVDKDATMTLKDGKIKAKLSLDKNTGKLTAVYENGSEQEFVLKDGVWAGDVTKGKYKGDKVKLELAPEK